MSRHSEDGARYRAARQRFLADNPLCWICGHGGADTIDHDPPRAVHRVKLDLATWRPAHGVRGCPVATCRRRCNQERGTRPIEALRAAFVPAMKW
ncbi:hypothetical protein ABZX66_20860 [Micromonospora aurantiaca]|uniref:hypothetical protein n=1 Tax=Micromonospora aurantiaca (nom. illeg.) TaxID=47850 RepID=UPI0033ADE44D